jgi:hypothetical protein
LGRKNPFSKPSTVIFSATRSPFDSSFRAKQLHGSMTTLDVPLQQPPLTDWTTLRATADQVILSKLESEIGDLTRSPKLRMSLKEIVWLNLDHRAGFLLSRVDGKLTFEDLFMLSGMTRLETAKILTRLLQEGVIE